MKKKLLFTLLSGLIFTTALPVAAAEIPIEAETDFSDAEEISVDAEDEISIGTQEVTPEEVTASEEIPIDAVHFPDKKFRTRIASSLIDQNKDGMLSVEERAEVTEFHLYDPDDMGEDQSLYYNDMTGVEYFFNLTYLELVVPDGAADVDFSQMPHLEFLNIMEYNSPDLDLSQNLQLNTLYISPSKQNAKNIQLAENNQIEELHLYDENGVVESFEFLNKLRNVKDLEFWLQRDREYGFDFSSNPNLEYLQIYRATLTSLNLTQNTALRMLTIRAADIFFDSMDLSKNKNLIDVSLSIGSSSKLGFLDIENCNPAISMYPSQKMVLSKNKEGYYDLADIPGYNPKRFKSIRGGKLSGSKIIPQGRYVFYTYYLDSRGKNNSTFTFDCGKQINPAMIEGLQITNTTTSTITCSWKPCSTSYSGYVVYARNENNGTIAKRIVVKKGTTSCKITGLKAGGKYTIIVRAYRSYQGKNYYSPYYEGTRTLYTRPATPTLKVSKNSGGKVTFSWSAKSTASSGWKSGYLIYYRQKGTNSYTRLPEVSSTTKTCTTTKLKKGKTYYVKMRSYIRTRSIPQNFYSDFTKPLTITVK